MQRLAKEGLFSNINKVEISIFEHCLIEKISKRPFEKGRRAEYSLKLVHFDICNLMNVRTRHGGSYLLTITFDMVISI